MEMTVDRKIIFHLKTIAYSCRLSITVLFIVCKAIYVLARWTES